MTIFDNINIAICLGVIITGVIVMLHLIYRRLKRIERLIGTTTFKNVVENDRNNNDSK